MAYVRQRGRQVLIVHGEREPGTKKVEQRVLFTLYTQEEAHEAIGPGADRFAMLLQAAHPEIRFDWRRIRREIGLLTAVLPEQFDYDEARVAGRFREGLRVFARQLMLSDPQDLIGSAQLVQRNRHELAFLADLIRWRLEVCDQKETQWNRDNAFHWRFILQGRDLPNDTEEMLAGYWERRELEQAESLFRLAVECFEGYAEGYNYLGLVALEQGHLDQAIAHFQQAVEIGRRRLPRRVRRNNWWTDLNTRPYMRGLRNLALTLNRAGRFDEALAVCDRLESECGDRMSAQAHRAAAYLNTGRFPEAIRAALYLRQVYPSESLIAGLAQVETGQLRPALASIVHAALNLPRTTRLIAGLGSPRSKTSRSARDHEEGVELAGTLHAYLRNRRWTGPRFVARALKAPLVQALLAQKEELERRSDEERAARVPPPSEVFRKARDMESLEFAEAASRQVADSLGLPPALLVVGTPRGRRRAATVH